MRSVNRGSWPVGDDGRRISFANYSHAREPLIDRLGEYCSYCERPGDLHVEHVVPRSKCSRLKAEWSNFLLGCTNCNGRKSNHNDARDGYLWPDSDDTFSAFLYRSGGRVEVKGKLDDAERSKACALFGLLGLGVDEKSHGQAPAQETNGMGPSGVGTESCRGRGFEGSCDPMRPGDRILQHLDGSVS